MMRVNRLAPAFIGVIAAVAMATWSAYAEPSVSETINYYDVSGANAREVRESLNRNGPVSKTNGKRFDAYTGWRISWSTNTGSRRADVPLRLFRPRSRSSSTFRASRRTRRHPKL